jgi:hypothetical protein
MARRWEFKGHRGCGANQAFDGVGSALRSDVQNAAMKDLVVLDCQRANIVLPVDVVARGPDRGHRGAGRRDESATFADGDEV